MNLRNATLKELVVVRHFDEHATLADKVAAEQEIIRRQRKERSGKPERVTGRMVFRT